MTPELKSHDAGNFLNRILTIWFLKFSKGYVPPASGNTGGLGAQGKEVR